MTYLPDTRLLARLGNIASALGQAVPIDKEFELEPAYLAILPGGELYLDSRLQLDTDGWTAPDDDLDDSHNDQTSLRYANGSYVNANEVPFFVLPGPESWAEAYGIRVGDYAAVLFETLITFAVFGDTGKSYKIGEGSIELLRRLGEERILDDGSVWDTDMGPGIVTIVLPGSGKGNDYFATQEALIADIEAVGRERFASLGGILDE
jgi:hypothetical protein